MSLAALSMFALVAAATDNAGDAHASSGPPPGCTANPVTSTSGASFTASETLCRSYFDKGVVDTRHFTVNVSNTQGLRNGQVITVSWSGAHPTGGIISDQQLSDAATQEYPVVLMECRGADSTAVPLSQRLSPQTCWTGSVAERRMTSPFQFQPMWSLDQYNPPAQQAPHVNVPSPVPAACSSYFLLPHEYWLPFVGVDGTKYPIGPQGCAGAPAEMLTSVENPTIVPSDTTYASTAPDGTGSAKFTIATSEIDASLGCSQKVQCSLEVVPVEGISCNSNPTYTGAAAFECENSGMFPAGELNTGGNPTALAVTGTYWWSQSNWQRRISVPLNFATPADACKQSAGAPLQFYGSELMTPATQQWNPRFCLDPKLFNVEQVQLSEPQAKESVQQNFIEAAIQAAPPIPPGPSKFFTTPTVQAPVGVTGFAISYVIDKADGTPYTRLKLDPRLLAKLMTDSYYGTPNIQSGDSGIAHNPQSIYDDPEFQALNPTFVPGLNVQPAPAATLFSILTRSDVMWSLTSYIYADPEARSWLNGQPDPWGMTVNPYYKSIRLPVESWPLLDTSTNGPDYTAAGNQFCVGALGAGAAKIPDRPLIDNPEDTLGKVAYNLQYSIAISLIGCNNSTTTPSYLPFGPELLGSRFLIGLVSLPQAEQLDLDTAALQSYASPEVESISGSTFAAGRVFVAPSSASLRAAASLFKPDATVGSWRLPYEDFPANSAVKNAYPGTLLVSADVPTRGIPTSDAGRYGQYLDFAATSGQVAGAGSGQLPAGYLPLTAANGLASQIAYTKAAALDVAAQNGQVPPLKALAPVPAPPPPSPSHDTTTVPGSGSTGSSSLSGSGSVQSSGSASTETTGGTQGSPRPGRGAIVASSRLPSALALPAAVIGRTLAITSGLGGVAVGIAMLVAIGGGGAGGVMWWRRKRSDQR